MCAKKKTAPNKIWKLAGQPLPPSLLTADEREQIEFDFSSFQGFRSGDDQGVSPSAARKNDIPVRYFGSASAKKCAVKLALDELAADKRME